MCKQFETRDWPTPDTGMLSVTCPHNANVEDRVKKSALAITGLFPQPAQSWKPQPAKRNLKGICTIGFAHDDWEITWYAERQVYAHKVDAPVGIEHQAHTCK